MKERGRKEERGEKAERRKMEKMCRKGEKGRER